MVLPGTCVLMNVWFCFVLLGPCKAVQPNDANKAWLQAMTLADMDGTLTNLIYTRARVKQYLMNVKYFV